MRVLIALLLEPFLFYKLGILMNYKLLLFILLLFSTHLLFAGEKNYGFPPESIQKTLLGEAVINQIDSLKDVNKDGKSENQITLIEKFEDYKFNYLAESIFILPVEPGNENAIIEKILLIIKNKNEYPEIPYFSKRKQKMYKLFYDMEFITEENTTRSSHAEINLRMEPFEPCVMIFETEILENGFIFTNYNRDKLYYKSFKAVKENKMQTGLVVEKEPGRIVFYGIGGAKAFNFFGLFKSRLETAFIGRVESFYQWLYDKVADI